MSLMHLTWEMSNVEFQQKDTIPYEMLTVGCLWPSKCCACHAGIVCSIIYIVRLQQCSSGSLGVAGVLSAAVLWSWQYHSCAAQWRKLHELRSTLRCTAENVDLHHMMATGTITPTNACSQFWSTVSNLHVEHV